MSMTNFPGGLTSFGMPVIPAGVGVPGNVYFCDPTRGSDAGDGKTPSSAKATLTAAYNLTTANQNDVVIFIGGATADNPSTAIAWSNSYTHLIGLSADLPGMGQRCRVVGTAANDLAQVITFSGNGCIVRNMQFFNGSDAAGAKGAAIVSGDRNEFTNVFFAGMGHATSGAEATAFSLKVTGSENHVRLSTIGLDTIVRSAANSELVVSGIRNSFYDCLFLSNSVTAGKFLVKIDNSGGDLRYTLFRDCLFHNYSENWATGITDVFDMPAGGSTHYVILQGNCMAVGVGAGWADTVTRLYHMLAAPATGGGVGIAVNT